MRVRLAALGLALACLTQPAGVFAGPDPAKLRAAADSFEAGAKAYKDGRFEESAAHFEAADSAVPSAKALRFAMRARSEAGQASRAATLAALALERYADDAETKKLAEETLEKTASGLHRVKVSCAAPCLVAAGTRIVHGEAATRWVVFLDPGSQTLGASFLGKIAAKEQTVAATAGGESSLRFSPAKDGSGSAGATVGAGGAAPEGGGGEGGAGGSDVGPPDEPKGDWRIHPAPFFVGLAVTVGLGATTIWSGIDTIQNPGADKVKEECRGQGEDCPLFQEGEAKEVRTNALIGGTAGAAALTVIFAIVADWDGDDGEAASASRPLWVDFGGARAFSGHSRDHHVVVGYRGRF